MQNAKYHNRKRIYMMTTGALLIFFTGFPHIWSIYQPYVMNAVNWTQTQASICFYISLATFVLGNIIGGKLQHKYSPKFTIIVGGAIFSLSILLSSFLIIKNPLPMYITYGVMQGIGDGMVYAIILNTAQKWFTNRTGFATGIIVTANALCGLIMTPISRVLLEKIGLKFTFLIIGIVITICWLIACIFFYVPKVEKIKIENKATKQYSSKEMLKRSEFYFLLIAMMFGLISYFLVSPVSQIYQIEAGIPTKIAVSSVMVGSIANAIMRISLPAISDKVSKTFCIKIVLLLSIIAMLMITLGKSYSVTFSVILIYGCYGGIMGIFPAITSHLFGVDNLGENYGLVMIGYALASISTPIVSKILLNDGFAMKNIFSFGIVFSIISFISLIMLEKVLKNAKNKGGYKCH